MCDNQYTLKVCLKLFKPRPCHVPLFHAIDRTLTYLKNTTTIPFHLIPGHTNNKLQQVDRVATRALQQHISHTLTIHQLLQNNTDATASGGAVTELLKKKKVC